ncbi:MAG TPA: methyltransferase domain-containing protein [Actinoplanes sp.]|nr:methyltransferase domain-containing protein [Actinoplanes sp.]
MTATVKDKHRAMWASGDYPAIAAEVVSPLGPILVKAAGIGPGQSILDVATGTGNAAIPAARAGATVTASDLTPDLLAAGSAMEPGLTWVEADAENLPFDTASYDTVISCIGVMFAPFHTAAAGEILRVCRPGGTIGLLNWTPDGFVGQMFKTMKPYAAPPPEGAQPPPLWGDPAHLQALLGSGVTGITAERHDLRVDRFTDAAEFRDYFKANYGPTIAVYRNIAGDPERTAALDAALLDLGARFDLGDGVMNWEYLLWTASRQPPAES